MSEEKTKLNFEAALEKLQNTVKRLESGELNLEDALKSFEEGVRLTRVCQEHLSVAEQKVEVLMKAGSAASSVAGESGDATKVELQPFAPHRS